MSSPESVKSNTYFECGDDQRDGRVFKYGPESSTKPLFSHDTPVSESSNPMGGSQQSAENGTKESRTEKIFDPKYKKPDRQNQESFRDDFIQENEDDGEVVLMDLSKRNFDYGPDQPFGHNAPLRVPSTPDDEIRSRRVFHYGPVEPKDKPLFDHNTPAPDKFADNAFPVGQVVPTDRSSRKFTYGPEEHFDHNKPYNAYTANVDELIYIDGEKHRREFHYGPADVPARPLFDHNKPVVDNNAGTSFVARGVIDGGLKVTDEERNARQFHYGPEVPNKPLFDHNIPVTRDRWNRERAFIDLEEERANRSFDSPVPVGSVVDGKHAETKAWFDDDSYKETRNDETEASTGTLLKDNIPETKGDDLSSKGEDTSEDVISLNENKDVLTDGEGIEKDVVQDPESLLDQDAVATTNDNELEDIELLLEDNIETATLSEETQGGESMISEEAVDDKLEAEDDLNINGEKEVGEEIPEFIESSASASFDDGITEEESSKFNNMKELNYYRAIQSLQFALKDSTPKLSEVRLWASELWDDLKTTQKTGVDLKQSMAAAKAAIAAHGPESHEAKEAWLYLESCASGKNHLEGTVLSTDMLQETADALATLEHLSNLVNKEKERLDDETQ
eukprot:CAMPEP_0178933838 /NCGR_PEP_ID=MMETSP0786-20121207/23515_1 /TAXON_ID=186022 /ORGANISM="Thalassionema frauenfeldii, Strain CCMP 1798" /LENGTH=620 /DNA_ID=CAMNT_0020611525 /DNA_START=178 /DNA_END=2040 /DNA_ORIENTATION=+